MKKSMLIFVPFSALYFDLWLFQLSPQPGHVNEFILYLTLHIFCTYLGLITLLRRMSHTSDNKPDLDKHLPD